MRCRIFNHICECKSEKADCDLLRSNLDVYTMIDLPLRGETGVGFNMYAHFGYPTEMQHRKTEVTFNNVIKNEKINCVMTQSNGAHVAIAVDVPADVTQFGVFAQHVYNLYERFFLRRT